MGKGGPEKLTTDMSTSVEMEQKWWGSSTSQLCRRLKNCEQRLGLCVMSDNGKGENGEQDRACAGWGRQRSPLIVLEHQRELPSPPNIGEVMLASHVWSATRCSSLFQPFCYPPGVSNSRLALVFSHELPPFFTNILVRGKEHIFLEHRCISYYSV